VLGERYVFVRILSHAEEEETVAERNHTQGSQASNPNKVEKRAGAVETAEAEGDADAG
jgi:hypothetical protein